MISSASTAFLLALLAPIQIIVDLLHPVLLFFHDTGGVGWGMSIVLLTVMVRALLAPLMVKQFKSMQAMVRVAPELKKLQAKFKDDKQRQQQEVMKFYSENKINPFASCLPLVAQMPFFIGLFYLLQSDLRTDICGQAAKVCGEVSGAQSGAEQFLFIPDLTDRASGWVLAVLIVMYIGSQLLSSLLTPSTADRNQRMLMYGLPFVFIFFVINFPAGLIVYWITTNLWTVAQGYILRKRMGPMAPPKEPALAGIPGASAGEAGGGLMARLSAAAGMSKPEAPASGNGSSSSSKAKASSGSKANSSGSKTNSSGSKAKASSGGGKDRTPAKSGGSGARPRGASKSKEASKSGSAAKPARNGPPPPSPRKKKKRSGRRR